MPASMTSVVNRSMPKRDSTGSVVYKLTRDCVRWYQADMDVLAQMSESDLERCVLEFLSKHDGYQAMLREDTEGLR